MKKTLSILLTLVLLLGTFAFAVPAAASNVSTLLASGNCGAEGDGSNVTWTLYSDYTLIFSGTGEMADAEDGSLPWDDAIIQRIFQTMGYLDVQQAEEQIINEMDAEQYRAFYTAYSDARMNLNLIIEEGITGVSNDAFSLMHQSSLTLPASVTHINGYYAHSLTSLTVLSKDAVAGIEVPAFTAGAIYPSTKELFDQSEIVGSNFHTLANLLVEGIDSSIQSFASNYQMTEEEIADNYEKLLNMVVVLYASAHFVEAATLQ